MGPVLIGAGLGALGGAVTGKNPFKTALMGAALGGGAGALGIGAGAGAAGAEGAAAAGATSAGAAGAAAAPTTAAEFEASMGLPNSFLIENGAPLSSAMPLGTANGFVQGASGNLINPNYYSNILGNQVYKGGEGLMSNMMGNMSSSLEDLKPYANIQNLSGVKNLADQFTPKPTVLQPVSGHISEGKLPQGGLGQGGVEGLLSELKRQKQRQPISLLVG